MGDHAPPHRRLRDLVAGLKASGSGCWGFKSNGGRIPIDPLGLANRSVRNSAKIDTSSYTDAGDHLSGGGNKRPPGGSVPGIGLSDGVEARRVQVNDDDDEEIPRSFRNNTIKTSKYNPLTFLPIFLFEMFSRVAYLYFLFQAVLSWWETVSPFGGFGATAALGFVLLMSGGKAILEDVKRHVEDDKMNKSTTTIVKPLTGEESKIKWKDIKVGDIIKVKDNELFPADLLCLNTGLEDGVCFIKTTNLDGESNLKIRKSVDLRSIPEAYILPSSTDNKRWVFKHSAILECEPPNKNLHKFKGRFTIARNSLGGEGHDQHISLPVSMNEMLLRGTLLKNSQHVHGSVVYTGHDTRIQMNAAKVPLKMGSFDVFLNVQITILIVAQLIFCLIMAAMNLYWRENWGIDRSHLAFEMFVEGNYKSRPMYIGIVFLTFWILTSYMVPISLFVTLEIVKFWQAFVFINQDPTMMCEDEPARARNSNLNEDLGKIEYVFSDKTGTLTSNDMQLRLISIKNQICGRQDFRLEELENDAYGFEALDAFDQSLAKSVMHLKKKGFWAALMSTGGSSQFVLSLRNSSPNLKKMLPMDRDNLNNELKRFSKTGCPEDVGQLDVYEGSSSRQDSIESLRTPSAKLAIRTKDVGEVVFGWHVVDFWTTVCICHSLITEERTDEFGEIHREYQGPSPDEIALVEAARKLGFEFRERTMTGIVLSMQGLEVRYEILNVLEFTSERKRMSVVVQSPDGTIHLFVKGADSVMLPRLKESADSPLIAETEANLHKYSTMGLRTLILGSRILDEETYHAWDAEYQVVAGSLSENQEDELNRMAEKLERDLELVGLTAIEDKLQDGVPMAIKTLRMAGIKVWMITGDKMETAINIAISCQLIHDKDSILVFQAKHHWDARDRLRELLKIANTRIKLGQKVELCVDGPSLVHILGKSLEGQLAQLGSKCTGVVICRSSPSQKAAVVRIMREFELKQVQMGLGGPILRFFRKQKGAIKTKMLAIGDGANDVTMIQAADIGVGIAGKEGRQAVNNSDYSLGQFRYLIRLLLVHGQLSHYRLARLIKFSFLKNITFAFILIFFQYYCGFSGQALVDDISAAVYNVAFTALPILLFSVLDRPLDDRTLIRFPQLYNMNSSLRTIVFWRTGVMQGILNAAVCFFIPYYTVTAAGKNNSDSLWALGKTIFVGLLGVVTLEVALVSRYWTECFIVVLILSFGLVFPYLKLFPYVERSLNMHDHKQYGIAENLYTSAHFWLCVLAVVAVSFGCRNYFRASKWLFSPDDNMILAEFEASRGPLAELTDEERMRLSSLDVIPPCDPHDTSGEIHSNSKTKISLKPGNKEQEMSYAPWKELRCMS